jgi:hypothetical protein
VASAEPSLPMSEAGHPKACSDSDPYYPLAVWTRPDALSGLLCEPLRHELPSSELSRTRVSDSYAVRPTRAGKWVFLPGLAQSPRFKS